jgi:hypothetical protein
MIDKRHSRRGAGLGTMRPDPERRYYYDPASDPVSTGLLSARLSAHELTLGGRGLAG